MKEVNNIKSPVAKQKLQVFDWFEVDVQHNWTTFDDKTPCGQAKLLEEG